MFYAQRSMHNEHDAWYVARPTLTVERQGKEPGPVSVQFAGSSPSQGVGQGLPSVSYPSNDGRRWMAGQLWDAFACKTQFDLPPLSGSVGYVTVALSSVGGNSLGL